MSIGKTIVTYGRSLIALDIAHSLGRRGIDIIGCDDLEMTVLSFSKYCSKYETYANPEKKPDQFIQDLVKIVDKHQPDDDRPYILMPSFYEARLIAKHRDQFEDKITVAAPDYDSIDQVDPKHHLARTIRDHNITAPKTWLPQSREDVEKIANDLPYPVFMKIPDGIGGRGIIKTNSKDQIIQNYSELKNDYPDKDIIIQEGTDGSDYCYCGLFHNGQRISSMVYTNLQKFPNDTGSGVTYKTVDNTVFDPLAEKLMKAVNWTGVVGIDFMWTGNNDDIPMMIEVNPRFWAGLMHSSNSNVDFPYMLYQLAATGKVTNIDHPKIGHQSNIAVLSNLSAMEKFFNDAIDFDALSKQWPLLRKKIKNFEITDSIKIIKDSLNQSITIVDAYEHYKSVQNQRKHSDSIFIDRDDALTGLGFLFILGSLVKYGEIPRELRG